MKNSFSEQKLRGAEEPGPEKVQWRIIYRGAAYLRFILQSGIKVDKVFLDCHLREGKDKWMLSAYASSNISYQKKDFPGQIIIAKFISRETAI